VHGGSDVESLRSPLVPFDQLDITMPAAAVADELGYALSDIDADAAAFEVGTIYTNLLSPEYRGEFGIFYTPPALARRLIDQATETGVDWRNCRIADPACGGGAFLAPVARRIVEECAHGSPRDLVADLGERLRGFEIDPFGAWLSQIALDAVLLPLTRAAGERLPAVVTVCDSLREFPRAALFDLIIGNPPYGRVKLNTADRAYFKRSLFGHANLYGLFTDLALRHTRPGGIVAYVTPTSFLAGEYFKNLRGLLGRCAAPVTLDFVSARKGVFDGVLQETILATYKRGTKVRSVCVHELTPANGSGLVISHAGEFAVPKEAAHPWIIPRSTLEGPLVSRMASMPSRLVDWGYTVSTGPLVWNRHKSQLSDHPGPNRYPLIWAEAITSDGRFVWRAEKRNHTLFFEVHEGDEWLVTRRPCVLLQRTTAKEQSRRLIAAGLPRQFVDCHRAVVVENHINMVRPVVASPPVAPATLAAFLNSAIVDRAFRCMSGSVAVSAYELESLPLPPPEKLKVIEEMLRGEARTETIDAAFARLYCQSE
jgi:adenine-specific DNA-methyltransferase